MLCSRFKKNLRETAQCQKWKKSRCFKAQLPSDKFIKAYLFD